MTAKRDLKRRARERKQETGESYVTALRQVRAQRPTSIQTVEMINLDDVAAELGIRCRILAFPGITEQLDLRATLTRFRDALRELAGDPEFATMRVAVLEGGAPLARRWGRELLEDYRQLLRRARAGIGGVSRCGAIALAVDGSMLLFSLRAQPPGSTLRPLLVFGAVDHFGPWPGLF